MSEKKKKPVASPYALQAAEEKEVQAHNAFKLLWKKVKTHAEHTEHVAHRDASLQRVRSVSATRAKHLREELSAGKEIRQKEIDADLAAKEKMRARVLKKEEAMAEEKDLRYHPYGMKSRKRREPAQEKLDAAAQAWVTTGCGGYNFTDLDSPRYQRSMMKAELSQRKEFEARQLELKKRAVAEMRATEAAIMNEKAGATARYGLPVKKSELVEKDNALLASETAAANEDGDDEDETKGRKMIPGVNGLMLPEFHKSEGKRQRQAKRKADQVLVQKTESAEKRAQADIDAAAKLLILHAHMLRKACVEANAAVKAEDGENGGDDE